jgi:hypothetical protein
MSIRLHNNKLKNVILVLMTALLAGLYASFALAGAYNIPLRHSDEGQDLHLCTGCHDANDAKFPYKRFDHTQSYLDHHGTAAIQNEDVCAMCHRKSFCSDCHGVGVELKPSVKNYTETKRKMPHRGDYLTRHRIDGRIDPTGCFGCHGSPKTQRSCSQCHT